MKKLFFVMLLTASYSFSAPLKDNPVYFKKVDNQWRFCREINPKEAECVNVDKLVQEIKKAIQLHKKNRDEADLLIQNQEQASNQLLQNIAIANIRYIYYSLQIVDTLLKQKDDYQKEPNLSKKEQQDGELQLNNEVFNYSCKHSTPVYNDLPEWRRIINADPSLMRSILPEEEQKMFDVIVAMGSK